ncbi:aldose 1-epimerase [Oceanimonas sp. GK1]|uniref:D-hexose-6-phosphate mutarotase n=1 Tax=Oceanimonas sp. (strain GK1 / IBRC-M 10197) TaxID=511062 RepID=UPI0002495122|nr:D-hexose-6-phosphate mutarotase [Oceanimonas sp. GK1]AEY02704.1 aldose 1-epimerase [Oceanimonas sp. GK1]
MKIAHPNCHALISTQGAQLLHWQPAITEQPVLWHSDKAFWKPGLPVRGGIPLCWPWFGKHQQPSHGFARLLEWTLTEQRQDADATYLAFELTDNEYTKHLWPYAFLARVHMILGKQCDIQLEVDCNVNTTAALHTYLRTGNVQGTTVTGLGEQYQDALQGLKPCSAGPALQLDGPVDRIYTTPPNTTVLKDTSFNREIKLDHRHHSDLVVWNPWHEGEHHLADVNAGQFQEFFCIETAAINRPCTNRLGVSISLPS